MTLQTSGAISMPNVQTEFGGSNPISMSEYYAGGVYVPSGTSGTNGAVPTSGAISLSKFYGTSSIVVNFTTETVEDVGVVAPAEASATYTIKSNGTVEASTLTGGIIGTYQWVTPTTNSTSYQVFATLASGSISSGFTGSWLNTTVDNTWDILQPLNGSTTGTLNFQVRKAGNSTVLDTWSVTLSTERSG